MRIGCLQFAPKLGQVEENIRKADFLLEGTSATELDLLVLPEMAFSGNTSFGSLVPKSSKSKYHAHKHRLQLSQLGSHNTIP